MEAVEIDVYKMIADQGLEVYPIGSKAEADSFPKGVLGVIIIIDLTTFLAFNHFLLFLFPLSFPLYLLILNSHWQGLLSYTSSSITGPSLKK